jgi:oligosaccharide reducing-end xylanase
MVVQVILPLRSVLLLGILVLTSCTQAEQPQHASENKVESGRSPNIFADLGISPTKIQARLEADYQQLFSGHDQDQRVFYPAGSNAQGPMAYIKDIYNNDVRSEGMSYGMMIAVQMNKKADFDALWNWSLSHMYHSDPQHPSYGYFSWSLSTTGAAKDEMPAPDGEEYFATALYFAAARWGNSEGIYHYSSWADRLLTTMLHRQVISGKANGRIMTVGNMFNLQNALVRFSPEVPISQYTDASYHTPAFYEVWARVGPEADRAFWLRAAAASRDYFVRAAHPKTALTPDYGEFDGRPWAASWRPESVDFRYDAWRTAMNWSMDWAWWRKDPRQQALSDRLQSFFAAQGMKKYQSLYSLDGKSLGGGQSTALISMNAVASLAATHSRRQNFTRALWELKAPTGQYRYYDGMLYLLAMLNCSGEYRDWTLVTEK